VHAVPWCVPPWVRALLALLGSMAAGGCVCRPGTAFCDGECAELSDDPSNCGACGTTCPTGTCADAQCVPDCLADAECDDGSACNGRFVCLSSGLCAPAGFPSCDDGLPCTVDRCVDPDGSCEHEARDDLCAEGERCIGGTCAFCPGLPCDISLQCGCSGDETCHAAGAGATCATSGPAVLGERCTPTVEGSDCGRGLSCGDASWDGSGWNLCGQYCTTDDDCAPLSRCAIPIDDGGGGLRTDLFICTAGCDPLGFDCPSGGQCFLGRTAELGWFGNCTSPAGTATRGAPCGRPYECGPRMHCTTVDDGPATCRPLCRFPEAYCPPGTGPCLHFLTPAVVGDTEYGACG
jgi:hypothetical protein